MYGVRKLAEQNLIALILSCTEHAGQYTRLSTFSKLCGFLREPASHNDADAEMVCNMYTELHANLSPTLPQPLDGARARL